MGVLLPLVALATAASAFLLLEEISRDGALRRAAVTRVRAYRCTGAAKPPQLRHLALSGAWAERVARYAPWRSREATAAELVSAGLANRITAPGFIALELLSIAGLVLAGLAISVGAGLTPGRTFLVVACLASFGAIAPRSLLQSRSRRRVDEIRLQLPDTLDLLAIAVTAGLSLDAAIGKVVEVGRGALAEELALVLAEIRVGESRQDALQGLAQRVGAPEVTALVRSLVQSEHLGVPLAQTLLTQAEEARRRRWATTEEKAGKAPVKMLFPTTLFIFPALFVVILAPALLSLTKQL